MTNDKILNEFDNSIYVHLALGRFGMKYVKNSAGTANESHLILAAAITDEEAKKLFIFPLI